VAKILIVDDNDLNCDMLQRRLDRKGFETDIAKNGLEAIEKTKSFGPDIVLMDTRMPEMDGPDATKAIKSDPDTGHVIVMALSGDTHDKDRERALSAGCDHYFTKPVDFKNLLSHIQDFLSKEEAS
jgi:CheY-like chemotaxis protein